MIKSPSWPRRFSPYRPHSPGTGLPYSSCLPVFLPVFPDTGRRIRSRNSFGKKAKPPAAPSDSAPDPPGHTAFPPPLVPCFLHRLLSVLLSSFLRGEDDIPWEEEPSSWGDGFRSSHFLLLAVASRSRLASPVSPRIM